MKNRDVNNIDDFKKRYKKLYEYKVHDLNRYKEESVYQMQEDEQEPEPPVQNNPQPPVQQNSEPQPKPPVQQEPVQQTPIAQPNPPVQQPEPQQEDNQMMLYLKSEMQKLENIVGSLEAISNNVNAISQRLDSLNSNVTELNKVVDEIKEPSDFEKLEMRAFDSYPYNKTLDKVWDSKMKSKEEQDMERMGVYKTDDGFAMDYTPQRNFNHNQTNLNL
jgi:hypothetical protein